ncbi:class I tRNA ligase family protein, partial [Patescibacteria group bacterium]|nr:class I tRNA ligase family protein [Patescibacteria group bacterium]
KSQKNKYIEVFTTRPDTLFGATFMCLAPENDLIKEITTDEHKEAVNKYVEEALNKSEIERLENKEKTGVFTGAYVINPVNDEKIPIWVADYVLADYGSGAIMCVPGHDERDYEFATKYNLPIVEVVRPVDGEPRPDAEHKNTITAIVQRKSDNKILLVQWKKQNWLSPPIGGIENGETPEAAAERELLEETGYRAKAVKKLGGQIESHFYADHKKLWRSRLDQPIMLELVDEKPVERSAKKKDLLKPVWMDPHEAINKITHHYNTTGIKRMLGIEKCFTGEGRSINSGMLDGLITKETKETIIQWLQKKKLGQKTIDYKIRDWLFSRQRYWGEPIPLVHCKKCGIVPVPYEKLPLELPDLDNFQPTDSGESPLANATDWVNTKCPKCNGSAKRETNTMPQWAGSCWYYLRFIDPHNDQELADPKKLKQWLPVDFYVGGAEHAVLHLLYARFWHKFLYDIKLVPTKEPFAKLRNVGLVMSEDGTKMSKSKGNVVNPDDMIAQYGADTFRAYEMFMGPFSDTIAWDTQGMQGVRRWLNKVWNLAQEITLVNEKIQETPEQWLYLSDEIKEVELATLVNQNIKKITEQFDNLSLNTAVSHLMIFVNNLTDLKKRFNPAKDPTAWRQALEALLLLLAPICPHIAEELWQEIGHTRSVVIIPWPQYNPDLIKEETIIIPIQINGKRRTEIVIPTDSSKVDIIEAAKTHNQVKKYLDGKKIIKEIYIPGKILNLVVK